MKRFSAQYIYTGTGEVLKRGVITTDDEGTITGITDTGGDFRELQNTEFHNGIIVPGFVNCHCHLELSAMKGIAPRGSGLGEFIKTVREQRELPGDKIMAAIRRGDRDMYHEGISACGDISNTPLTFDTKQHSRIKYVNFLEVFGIDPSKASKRISEAEALLSEAAKYSAESYIVPHSLYSLSGELLSNVCKIGSGNRVTSIHFMESPAEIEFLEKGTGPIADSYESMELPEANREKGGRNHAEEILTGVTGSGNLVLVHNTFAGEDEVTAVMKRGNTYWCLCPGSNTYIENSLPPVDLLRKKGATVVLGTDSLASNNSLSILEEMKLISSSFPSVSFTELLGWATINGAMALGLEKRYGTIEKTKRPGLVLLENISLENPEINSRVTTRRLI